jgi:hypothetical protein
MSTLPILTRTYAATRLAAAAVDLMHQQDRRLRSGGKAPHLPDVTLFTLVGDLLRYPPDVSIHAHTIENLYQWTVIAEYSTYKLRRALNSVCLIYGVVTPSYRARNSCH